MDPNFAIWTVTIPRVQVSSDVEKLKRKLRKRVAQAVDAVCGEWAQTQTLQPADVSLDRSYGSCKKLVAYIAANMATSPGFVEQMDRVILACFSGASKRVLSNVATQEIWFRAEAEGEPPRRRRGPAGHEKPSAAAEPLIKLERVAVTNGTAADGAGIESREVVGSLLAKRPRSRTSKKKLSTKRSLQALVVAEPKKVTRRRVDASSAEESVEAETETDEQQENRKRPKKRTAPKPAPTKSDALPVEDEHGLLTFKEAIGELCYQERRTPEQTAFFKERLRKSIQFVDALLCRPPPDRCKNTKCEFKLRILVRETMHKLHNKQLEISTASHNLRKKNADLDDLNTTELSEPGTFVDAIATLESEIESLEEALVGEEAEMAEINSTLDSYWTTLSEIGIESRHDEIDNFQEFVTHYAHKKKRR